MCMFDNYLTYRPDVIYNCVCVIPLLTFRAWSLELGESYDGRATIERARSRAVRRSVLRCLYVR